MHNKYILYLGILLLCGAQDALAQAANPPSIVLPNINRTIQVKPTLPGVPAPMKPTVMPEKIGAEVIDKTEEGVFTLPSPLRGEELNLRSIQKAFDTAAPTATIKSYEYDPKRRYDVRLRVYTGTLIKLPDDEEIKAMALGDTVNFAVTPFTKDTPNLAYVQVINAAGVDTTLMFVGKSKRIYNFYLRGEAVNSPRVPTQMVQINAPSAAQIKSFQFEEAAGGEKTEREPYIAKAAQKQGDYLKTIATPASINTHYKIYGNKVAAGVAPYAVYDDGHFTYFDYRDTYGELPALFRVSDGIDSRNNTDKKDGFLIAQGVSQEGWTLKHGDKTICIRPTENIRAYWSKNTTLSSFIEEKVTEEAPVKQTSLLSAEYSYPSERK